MTRYNVKAPRGWLHPEMISAAHSLRQIFATWMQVGCPLSKDKSSDTCSLWDELASAFHYNPSLHLMSYAVSYSIRLARFLLFLAYTLYTSYFSGGFVLKLFLSQHSPRRGNPCFLARKILSIWERRKAPGGG